MDPELETVAFRMTLNPGQADEYRRRHDDIWPELTAALKDAGVVDYRIFLDEQTCALFAVMTRRIDHELDTLPRTDIMQRWWKMMADIMETRPDDSPIQSDLREMFVLTTSS